MNNAINTLFTFVHRTKKLLVSSTGVGSYLIMFPSANGVDPELLGLDLLCLQKIYEVKG